MASISAKDVKALRDRTGAGMMDCKHALGDAEGDLEKAGELLRERGLAKAGKRAGRATSEGTIGLSLTGQGAGIVELGCETDFVAKTDAFQTLAQEISDLLAGDATLTDADTVLAAKLGDGSVGDRIQATIAKVGENIELKRASRLSVESGTAGGYIHAGGKLGVIVGIETAASGDRVAELGKDLAMHVAATDPTPIAVDRDGVPQDLIAKERELLGRQALQSGKPENVIQKIVDGRLNKFFAENCLLEQPFVKDPDRSVGDLVKSLGGDLGAELRVSGFARFKVGEAIES